MTDVIPASSDNRPRNLLEIPAVRQGLLLTGIAASVAIGIATVLWSRTPDYSLLYSNLADRDAGAIVNTLMAAEIPHKIEQSSGGVMVPKDRVAEIRLLLASEGLPQGAGLGFELIGDEKGLGTSQFMESAKYQHMLETELVRTISSLRPVQTARVHLALPKQSVFVRDRRQASASVMVELYPGRRLEESQVAAIVHLVSASIPDLAAGEITVVDQQGRLLTGAEESAQLALNAQQFAYKTRVEESYASRIESLLAPLAGAGKIRAQVTAAMDFTVTERTQESFDPDTASVRSEQNTNQTQIGDIGAVGGVPGALSNQPADTPDQLNADGTSRNSSSSAVRNFELDRTVSHIRQPSGVIQRLSVAVIVDDRQTIAEDGTVTGTARTPEELERMTALTREAVGFDSTRGDTVNVVNASFTSPAPLEIEAAVWWEMPLINQVLRQLVGVVLILGLIFGLLRPTVKHLLVAPPARVVALPAGELGALGHSPTPVLSHEQSIAAARTLVGEDPKRAARVVKDWVAESE